MRLIPTEQANRLLAHLRLEIGKWNQIAYQYKTEAPGDWFRIAAPDSAGELYRLCLFLAGWPSMSDWSMLQLDNSNQFTFSEASVISDIFLRSDAVADLNAEKNSTIIIECDNAESARHRIEIACLIYFLLLFKAHAYLLSSAESGDHMSLHVGVIHFMAGKAGQERAKSLFTSYENRNLWPSWLAASEVWWQEHALRGDRPLN